MELPFLGYPYAGSSENASHIIHDLNQKFPEMRAEYSAAQMMFLHTNSGAGFHTLKYPIRTLEDFDGLLIRAAGGDPARTQRIHDLVDLFLTNGG